MEELVNKLNYYTEQYNNGNPLIPDTEWDRLYYQLIQMEKEAGYVLPNSPTQKVYYPIVNELKKVAHNHPMLSLDKTKSINDVQDFLKNESYIAMAKMDGLTCSIHYQNGELISAETRGNGEIGEDITHNIVFVQGVPKHIDILDDFIVDGEIIVTLSEFKNINVNDEYKNPRNYASGSIRLLNSKESAARHLTFVVWDVIQGIQASKLSEKLRQLPQDFICVPSVSAIRYSSLNDITEDIDFLKETCKSYGFPIDGIVFKYDDCAYYNSLGYTGHHFRGGLAFKFEDDLYETELINIEWSMGKTGQLTPVAIFKSIDIDGTTVERASLHNINIMDELLGNAYKGQTIYIYKANQIIPQIHHAEHTHEGTVFYLDKECFDYPRTCPICGGQTKLINDNTVLVCDNPNCEGKLLNQLDHFVGKKGLDIKGLSKATLQKLIDWGWVGNRIEIFSLKNFQSEWEKKPGFGEKSVANILNAIDAAVEETELWHFISGLAIPLIGSTYAKEMAKREMDWFNIREDIEGGYNFTQWANFGYEMNESLHKFDYTEADELAKILHLKNSLWKSDAITPDKSNCSLTDKTFVITGSLHFYKNRDALIEAIENHGGKVVGTVTKKVNYLINNDTNSETVKNKKAKELGVAIISEDDLIAML